MRKLFFLLLFFAVNFVFGQPSSYVKYFGDPQLISYGHSVCQSATGSIYYGGHCDASSSLYSLISFKKLDEYGNEIFTKYFGDSIHHFMLMRMISLNDGNYLLAGSKMIHGGSNHPLAIKLDSSGSVIFELTDTSGINSWFSGVSEMSNGNLVFTGVESDSVNADINLMGMITDASGNFLHRFYFGDAGINETSENNVVDVNGTIYSCGDKNVSSSVVNPYVAAFDSTGNFLWSTMIDSHFNSGSKNLFIDDNGYIVVAGESATPTSSQFDIQLSKFVSSNGSLLWSRLIPGTDLSDAGFAISETDDGNYTLTGYGYDSSTAAKRICLIFTDTAANQLSKKYFGSSTINIGYDIYPSVFGGFLIAGTDFINNNQVLIYQKESGIGIDELFAEQFNIFPNPVFKGDNIKMNTVCDVVSVFDISGKVVSSDSKAILSNEFVISGLDAGVYFIKVEKAGKVFTKRLIVCE